MFDRSCQANRLFPVFVILAVSAALAAPAPSSSSAFDLPGEPLTAFTISGTEATPSAALFTLPVSPFTLPGKPLTAFTTDAPQATPSVSPFTLPGKPLTSFIIDGAFPDPSISPFTLPGTPLTAVTAHASKTTPLTSSVFELPGTPLTDFTIHGAIPTPSSPPFTLPGEPLSAFTIDAPLATPSASSDYAEAYNLLAYALAEIDAFSQDANVQRRAASTDIQLANGQDAKALNAKFATLTADSMCDDGEEACVGGQFSQCVGGKFVSSSCGATLQCFALPLVNSRGTSITCTTQADASQRIGNTGAGALKRRAAGADVQLANGKDAQALNAQFSTLSPSSACTAGSDACVNGEFAQCVGGSLVSVSCGATLQCFVLPLVNSRGTSVTCTTAADAQARISNSGAKGGITG
ncbi:hypothetical protein BD410DRAFT_783724 [Rickenella mellea]|uniref:Carbohydrate-binding module family 19 domain-containing protein n=1 Tax=Rickenella mellea TaxID=50990 RepID=A0A4Y7QG21_9AGAM|nr:hypothetical protein BD410DRAFT_783724 [Rickenella mellea]